MNADSSRPAQPVAYALALSLLFWAGCATTTEVKVDSLAKPAAENAISYRIQNRNPLVADDSLRYKEAAGFVKTALSGKGMYEAPENTPAELLINLDYGVGPPQVRRETRSEPFYIMIPGEVRTERVQVGIDSQGRPIYQTITYREPPREEFAGYRDYVVTYIVYEKYLKLAARDNGPAVEGRPPQDIWTIDVTSEGESRDLRKNLPYLVAATIDFVGKDSQGQKTIRMKDSNSDVAFVKKGM